jgi:trans-2,3-dihydro-3-hydroxyanthranilate isomerase
MRKVEFVQADVFSDSPFGGNPVVVVVDPGDMSPEEMQSLARGMAPAETAFVFPPSAPGADFLVRFFSPTTEVPYSGHCILGAAYVLASTGRLASLDVCHMETGIGVSEVELDVVGGVLESVRLRECAAVLEHVELDLSQLCAGLGIEPSALLQTGLPVQLGRAGLATLIVPLPRLDDVRRILPVRQALDELLHDLGGDCVLAFTCHTLRPENDVHVRVFAPPLGVEEDPASGSANGALGVYLLEHGVLTDRRTARFRSEQGTEVGRPSVVRVAVDISSPPGEVHVGGSVARSVEGTAYF